ncbi:uncharacterized protein LOC112350193 [Selaginella moellendorffii]|uniref:uncharacterized protein LOC112350193 n=1 Tax=Selaginella moellendorffii TaxID=88036 RepID=UPI000D1C77C1|nr:uncharacterized protein LOC112350193 [Selaginella moellendorffii]|eukprot:XP_024541743.1 uncharacterized protein LOC112350193 [Selaginella moellendorffii]
MAFSCKPDRSKFTRSPVAPKKSPCQVVPRQEGGGFARKCSSPVFTSSPMRPPVRRGLPLPVPKTPDHQHLKENGPPCKIPSSPASSNKQRALAKPASPKKILGEHNVVDAAVVSSKRCRKEWQIPSSSGIELKESLSGMESPADAACAVDQVSTFPVNVEVLGEPEPVAGWVQERSTTHHREVADSKDLARNLFGGVETPGEHQSPQHSSSGSSSHGTIEEEDLAIVSSMIFEKVELDDGIVHAAEEALAAVTSIESNVAAVVVEETKTVSDVHCGRQKISRSIKWSGALGFLVLLLYISALAAPPRQILHELWSRRSEFCVVPGEIEWSSEADTVGLYVNPATLLEHCSVAKRQLLELYEKSSGKLAEGLGFNSVRIITSYYSSLVLGNHAKDVLFNSCREFQGQYYRLRVATVSLIEQAIPLESTARDVLTGWSFEDIFSKARQWFTSVESYANEALIHRYLRLPSPSISAAHRDVPYFEKLNEEADGNTHVAETDPVFESDEVSKAIDWIGDTISVCRLPEHRSPVNSASMPNAAVKQDMINEADTELEIPNAGENYFKEQHDNNNKPYLGAVLIVAVLGLAVSYRLQSPAKVPEKPPVEEFSSPACELSVQDIMRMRGADEELILTPEQETGGYSPYGSFTAYKRVVYNEGSEKEEVKLTPVRRSSRIRNQVPRLFTS